MLRQDTITLDQDSSSEIAGTISCIQAASHPDCKITLNYHESILVAISVREPVTVYKQSAFHPIEQYKRKKASL